MEKIESYNLDKVADLLQNVNNVAKSFSDFIKYLKIIKKKNDRRLQTLPKKEFNELRIESKKFHKLIKVLENKQKNGDYTASYRPIMYYVMRELYSSNQSGDKLTCLSRVIRNVERIGNETRLERVLDHLNVYRPLGTYNEDAKYISYDQYRYYKKGCLQYLSSPEGEDVLQKLINSDKFKSLEKSKQSYLKRLINDKKMGGNEFRYWKKIILFRS